MGIALKSAGRPVRWFKNTYLPANGQSDVERRTLKLHFASALLSGMFGATGAFAAYFIKKELLGDDETAANILVAVFSSLFSAVYIFSTIGAAFITEKNHRLMIILFGATGRLSFMFLLIASNPYLLVSVFVLSNLCHALYLPAQNMILQANYPRERRGHYYAVVQVPLNLIMSMTALAGGRLMDSDPTLFPWIATALGVCGFGAYLVFAMMPRAPRTASQQDSPAADRGMPFSEFFKIVRRDRLFLKYELCFCIYGGGFFITNTLLPIYLHDVLAADWKQASTVMGVIHPIFMLIFLPIFGKLLDRTNAIPVAGAAFFILAFWPFAIAAYPSIEAAYIAAVFLGIGMAGVDVAWVLGSLTFAKENEIRAYTAVHVTFVGFRALVFPFVALALLYLVGFQASFFISFGMFVLGAIFMLSLYPEYKKAGKQSA